MSGQEDKNPKNAKSKIEQIREELEKKLAVIEKDKAAPQSKTATIDKESISKELERIKKEAEIVDKKKDLVFEISDKIERIEDVKEDKISKNEDSKKEFESKIEIKTESSKTKNIVEAPVKGEKHSSKIGKSKKIGKSETSISEKTTKNTIIPPPNTVEADIHVNQQKPIVAKEHVVEEKEEDFITYVEEKSKKKSNFFLYALLLLLFGGIAYLLVNYLNQNKEQQKIIMNQKLSEFKNKRYLDSIELADLNNQLIDLQSNKLIDSIDQVYEKELLDNSKFKNKEVTKRNFSVEGNEIINNSNNNTRNKWKSVSSSLPVKKTLEINPNVNYTNNSNNEAVVVDKASNTSSSKNTLNNNETSVNNSQIDNEEIYLTKNETSLLENSNNNKQTAEKLNDSPIEIEENTPKIIKAPIFPGCEKKRNELDVKRCFVAKLYKNIARNFNSNLAQNIGLNSGKHVVKVNFIIDKHGYANVIHVRAADKILEDEAIRVIQALPKMKPGTVNGKQSNIPYNIPIRYIVEN